MVAPIRQQWPETLMRKSVSGSRCFYRTLSRSSRGFYGNRPKKPERAKCALGLFFKGRIAAAIEIHAATRPPWAGVGTPAPPPRLQTGPLTLKLVRVCGLPGKFPHDREESFYGCNFLAHIRVPFDGRWIPRPSPAFVRKDNAYGRRQLSCVSERSCVPILRRLAKSVTGRSRSASSRSLESCP
jgi:hypothetical protein